jgi:hypothetical protein
VIEYATAGKVEEKVAADEAINVAILTKPRAEKLVRVAKLVGGTTTVLARVPIGLGRSRTPGRHQSGAGMGFRWSVERSRRRLVRKLADGIGDAPPDGGSIVIVLGGELVCTRGAFLERLVAIPLKHQVGSAPDVDLRYHAGQLARSGSPTF